VLASSVVLRAASISFTLYLNVSQTVVRGGPQAFGGKGIGNIVSDTERMKNTPMHVCVKTIFVS
jgi:hypothetical protein